MRVLWLRSAKMPVKQARDHGGANEATENHPIDSGAGACVHRGAG
jgi:hypothetical protein